MGIAILTGVVLLSQMAIGFVVNEIHIHELEKEEKRLEEQE